jgi:hypothetical protein
MLSAPRKVFCDGIVAGRCCSSSVNRGLRIVLLSFAFLSGCERQPTRADLEREVLRTVFRYFYDHDIPDEQRAAARVVFVGTPGDFDDPNGRPIIEMLYHDPSPEWLSALAATGIPTRPASQAAYTPTREPPFYYDPKTGERALVFSIHSIVFPSPITATVVSSSAVAPLAGGERTYQLAHDGRAWRVTGARITAVY